MNAERFEMNPKNENDEKLSCTWRFLKGSMRTSRHMRQIRDMRQIMEV